MTRNAPSLWDGGVEWGTAATEGANGYWQASDTASQFTGKPVLSVAIGGKRISGQFLGASWTLGRSDWLSTLAPNSASLTFFGGVDADPNDVVVISVEVDDADPDTHPDPFWTGRVETYNESQDVTGNIISTVSATDMVGMLGQVKMPSSLGTGVIGTLETLTESLALDYGSLVVDVVTDDTLDDIFGDPDPIDSTLLEFINRMEKTCNALLFLQGDGTLKAVVRKALGGSVVVVPLAGLDAPNSWDTQLSLGNVINKWKFGGIGSWTSSGGALDITASSDLYGVRSYEITDMLAPSEASYGGASAGLLTALATPRSVLTSATFPNPDLSSNVLWFDPLDYVSRDSTTWQVMQVAHNVTPGDWQVTIAADQTQGSIVGGSDPTPTDPDPTPGTTLVTQTYTSSKSSVVFKSSGGAFYGNGADDYLSVGYYASTRARGLIAFTGINWASDFPGFVRVKTAVLTLRTSNQTRVAFGSNPKFYVKRLTESWSEGSTSYPNDGSNAVIWPGPAATASGQVLKTIGTATTTDRDITITDIVQGWHDSGNYGLRLMSVNEDNSGNTIEFFSDDYATAGARPRLSITCEVS